MPAGLRETPAAALVFECSGTNAGINKGTLSALKVGALHVR
jgi:hypothetical protein